MKDKILEVLEAASDLELNLGSEAAREWIAEEIAEKIAKNIQETP